jgi:Domain of unknown function (DUF4260)
MLTKPRWLLHLEGAAILGLSLYFYGAGGYRWWLGAVLLLVPDLFMLGYLINVQWGSAIYNLVHTVTGPAVLLAVGLVSAKPVGIPYALIWLAHIGMDRALGFGLKYPTFFKDTHLQHV